MENQDWNSLTIRGTAPVTAPGPKEIRPRINPAAAHERKLMESDYVKPKILAPASRQEMVQKRVALKMNQDQLNQACQFPAHTIREIEAGRLTPNGTQLNALNRVLKTSLHLD